MIYPNHRKLLPPKSDEHSENEANHVPEKPREKKPPNPPSTFCPPALYPPPPSQNTHLIPSPVHDGGRSHELSSLPSFISFTIAFGILLGILAGLIRCCRSNHSRRRTNPTIIPSAQEHRDEENHQLQLENPIWFINTVGLQQSDINSIAVFRYKKDEGITEGTECSVCLGEFQEDERLRLLPKCNHAFHVACIDTWLRAHKNCPLCRAPIVISSNAGVGSQDNESGQLLRNQSRVASHVNLGSSNDEESIANETSNGHESSENLSSRVSGGKREIVEEHSSSGTSSTSLVHDAADEAQMTQLKNLKPKNSRKRLMRSFSSARSTSQGHMDMKRSSSVNGMFLKEDLNA